MEDNTNCGSQSFQLQRGFGNEYWKEGKKERKERKSLSHGHITSLTW